MAEFSPTAPDRATPRRPRRWLQFGFSTLLKLVALAAVLSAWWADRERLTDRVGRLENDQSVLQIAMGDGSPSGYEVGASFGSPQIYATQSYRYRAAPGYDTVSAPNYAPGSTRYGTIAWRETSRRTLYALLQAHQEWLLKANCSHDPGWQDFLAQGDPPVVRAEAVEWDSPAAGAAGVTEARLPLEAPDPSTADAPPATLIEQGAVNSSEQGNHSGQEEALAAVAVKQCLPALAELMTAGDTPARADAAEFLALLGTTASLAVPMLAQAANDPDERVRETVFYALARLGPAATAAAPRLSALLQAEDARSHPLQIADVLLAVDPQADATARVIESLRDQRPRMRAWALELLSSMDASRVADALPTITELLSDEDQRVRAHAIQAYVRLADRAKAIAVLQVTLRNERDGALKRYLARTIVRLQNAP